MNFPSSTDNRVDSSHGMKRSRTGIMSNGGISSSNSQKRKLSDSNLRLKGVNSNNQTLSVNCSDNNGQLISRGASRKGTRASQTGA